MAGVSSRSSSVYGGVAEPCTVVLFGASGDLAKRKVIPAMYDLAIHNGLGPRYAIVGFARTPMSDDAFRTTLGGPRRSIYKIGPIHPKQWDYLARARRIPGCASSLKSLLEGILPPRNN